MGYLDSNQEFDLYKDIAKRTQGEIYIGVVGPVRTGKSTFIKKFMELFVLPQIENEHEKERTIDELPQSSGGKTITTTEPKFIPKNAVETFDIPHIHDRKENNERAYTVMENTGIKLVKTIEEGM